MQQDVSLYGTQKSNFQFAFSVFFYSFHLSFIACHNFYQSKLIHPNSEENLSVIYFLCVCLVCAYLHAVAFKAKDSVQQRTLQLMHEAYAQLLWVTVLEQVTKCRMMCTVATLDVQK